MTKCVDQDFPCQDPDYSLFDQLAGNELRFPIPVSELINRSTFCTELPVSPDALLGDITHKTYLKALGDQSGLYHLWIDHDNCDDHGTYTIVCVYVGKGIAGGRINDHVIKKWRTDIQLYVTFTEIDNRLSKYYEQLFLDTYRFVLNKNENTGTATLFAVWDEDLHHNGTQLHDVSNRSRLHNYDNT